jgi:hypothetical protein
VKGVEEARAKAKALAISQYPAIQLQSHSDRGSVCSPPSFSLLEASQTNVDDDQPLPYTVPVIDFGSMNKRNLHGLILKIFFILVYYFLFAIRLSMPELPSPTPPVDEESLSRLKEIRGELHRLLEKEAELLAWRRSQIDEIERLAVAFSVSPAELRGVYRSLLRERSRQAARSDSSDQPTRSNPIDTLGSTEKLSD